MFSSTARNKRNGFGLDGISINDFKANEKPYISLLSKELRNGSYLLQQLNPHFIPKASGKDRVICVPTVRDRLLQRAVLSLLHSKGYGFENSISYGFVRDKSVQKAATQAVALRNDKQWVYKADISAFFDTVDRNLLLEKVRRKIRVTSLHNLIETFIRSEIHCRDQSIEKKIKRMGIQVGLGLRQGMPVSPYLANLYLHNFDMKIEKLNIPMVRYADDLVAFGTSKQECEEIHEICLEQLGKEGLAIHPLGTSSKTVIVGPTETVEFLGLGLEKSKDGYSLVVTKKQLEAITNKILDTSSIDHCLRNGITLTRLIRRLDDQTSGYYGAYDVCSNLEQLDHTLKAAKSKSLQRLFLEEFGIKYKNLTNKQKRFLQIE